MPTPPLPDAAAQRQAAVDVFAQYEPPLYEAYLDMMLEWLAAVRTAMFAGGVARLALMPDPMTVFSQGPKWAAVTAKYTAKIAREVLAAPYTDLFADGTLFDTRPFVRNWIARTENRLQAVPDEVFGLVSHIIDSGTTNGASIPDVQEQIHQLFGDTGQQRWKNRARTIARTEVVGAYNGGLHDAFSMLAEQDDPTQYVHRWLATEDQRTRPDHREADGQMQPWGVPFRLGPGGAVLMMHPHAPGAPANQCVNCRCVELMEIKNEPTEMSNRQYKLPSLAASFNPFQKRDNHGRWTLDLSAASKKLGRLDDWHAETGAAAHFTDASELRGSHKKAIRDYTGAGYMRVNEGLRYEQQGESLRKTTSPEARGLINDLDSAMRKAGGSKQDAIVYRGSGASMSDLFGSAWRDDGDNAGLEWTQASFISTSQDRAVVERAFKGDTMRIHVPKGTRGISTSGESTNPSEGEVLLDRGLRLRIVKDHGPVGPNGYRLIDVEVAPSA